MNETQQDRDDREAAEHDAAMNEFHQQAREALLASRIRPLTPDEIHAISWWGHFGITEKEIRL